MERVCQNLPPENTEFVDAYNALIKGFEARGIAGVLSKNKGDAVTQSDLDTLRRSLSEAAKNIFIDTGKLTGYLLYDPAAFDGSALQVTFNGDKGFLKIPQEYTSTGKNVYDKSGQFSAEVPVLWEHFIDLRDALHALRERKYDYKITVNIDNEGVEYQLNFINYQNGPENKTSEYDPEAKEFWYSWDIQYTSILSGNGATYDYSLFFRNNDGDSEWEGRPISGPPNELDVVIDRALAAEEQNAPSGEFLIQPVCTVNHTVELGAKPAGVTDSSENGVVRLGSDCSACLSMGSGVACAINDYFNTYEHSKGKQLGLSCADGFGLQVMHNMAVYEVADIEYGQYNCDTDVKSYRGDDTDEDGGNAKWEFHHLRRPSGALVKFMMKNGQGTAINGGGFYYLHRNGGELALEFPREKFTHYFSEKLMRCSYRIGNYIVSSVMPPGEGMKTSGTYIFDSLITGRTELTVNERGVPIDWRYHTEVPGQPAMARSLTAASATAQYDQLTREVTTLNAAADPLYDYAQFFAAGAWTEPAGNVVRKVIDFYNQNDVPMGKLIEGKYGEGLIVRGYWGKEAGGLEPQQLVKFERFGTEAADEFIEQKQTVKYSTGGRFESVSRVRKKKFPFGEETVAEYHIDGDGDVTTASYTYETNAALKSYGSLLAETNADGSWSRYEYDSAGRVVKTITPFGDAAIDAPEADCKVTEYDYTHLHPAEITVGGDTDARTMITKTLGVETAREYHLYFAGEDWQITAAAPGAAYDAVGNLVYKNFRYASGDFAGLPWRTENPDGSSVEISYRKIVDETDPELYQLETTALRGFLPDYGTREVTLKDIAGHVITRTVTDLASGLVISGTSYEYDNAGRVTREETLDGDVTATEYNCCGPRFVTDPAGNVTEYAHDTFGRLKFTEQAGVMTGHVYDADDREVSTVVTGKEEGELVTLYTYDADGRVLTATDPVGAVTAYNYEVDGETVTDPAGLTRTTRRYRDGRTKEEYLNGNLSRRYEYRVQNQELCTKEILSQTEWTISYADFMGRQTRRVTAAGYEETTTYDAQGRVCESADSTGRRMLTVYDPVSGAMRYQVVKLTPGDTVDFAADQVSETVNAYELFGETVTRVNKSYVYVDGLPVLRSESRTSRDGKQSWSTQAGRTTQTERQNLGDGEVTEIIRYFDGSTLTNNYYHDMLTSSENSVTGETVYHYDEFNRPVGQTANGIGESQVLDANGRMLSQTVTGGALALTSFVAYDLVGCKLSAQTPSGLTTLYDYDLAGNLAGVSGDALRQTRAYDDRGRLTSLTTYQDDATPQVTGFVYNSAGQTGGKVYADGSMDQYRYDQAGRLTGKISAGGINEEYSYNLAGRLFSYSCGENIYRTYDYRQDGVLTAVAEIGCPEASYSYAADAMGRIVGEMGPFAALDRTFDAAGRVSSLSLDNEELCSVSYGPGNLLAMVAAADALLTYEYESTFHQVASQRWTVNGDEVINISSNYDDLGRLAAIAVNDVTLVSYELDADGKRTQAVCPAGRWAYGYSGKGEVLSAGCTDAADASLHQMSYRYDGIGNRLQSTEDAVTTAYTANIVNRYTAVGAEQPSYDLDGNQLTGGDWEFGWSEENRLIEAVNGMEKLEFGYDYLGRRLTKKVWQGETLTQSLKFVYDNYKLIAVLDAMADDAVMLTLVWQPAGLDVPLAMTYQGECYFYVTDGNKNVIALYDDSGVQVAGYSYGPFGQLLSASGPLAQINPLRFSSEYFDDETNLVYYNYRYYSPRLGRWLSRDPIGESGGLNLYGMLGNNAVNSWDELGLFWSVVRNSSYPWAQTVKENTTDTISDLARSYGLIATEAFGSNGWLRKRSGAMDHLQPLSEAEFKKDRNWRCYAIPNTFVVRQGVNVSAYSFGKAAAKFLKEKKFYISSNPDVSTYGVLFYGHFSGGFKRDDVNKPIGYDILIEETKHKIAFFIGVGCYTNLHPWGKVVAYPSDKTLWLTNYYMSVNQLNHNCLGIRPLLVDPRSWNDNAGGFGDSGDSLNTFLSRIY